MNPQQIRTLLGGVESARRAKEYEDMRAAVHALTSLLGDDQSPGANQVRSQASYEQAMAAFQRATALLEEAKNFANQGAVQARSGEDKIGELFAKMILGGHILPALRMGREAIEQLKLVHSEVGRLSPENEADQARLSRVEMNVLLHLIDLAVEYDGDREQVREWLTALEGNDTFQGYLTNDPQWAQQHLDKARTFAKSKT